MAPILILLEESAIAGEALLEALGIIEPVDPDDDLLALGAPQQPLAGDAGDIALRRFAELRHSRCRSGTTPTFTVRPSRWTVPSSSITAPSSRST
jgi:hypothetical protein